MSNPVQNLDASLAAVVDKLGQLAEKHGGDAVVLAAKATALSLVPWMVSPFCWLCAAGLLAWLGRTAVRRGHIDTEENLQDDGWCVVAVFAFIAMTISMVTSIVQLVCFTLNPLYWAALADPRIALAAKALGLL